jgi:hypothetical protein
MYLFVLYKFYNKQLLFMYTALTNWLLYPRRSVLAARYEMILLIYKG